jgi:PmbA protein
MLTPEQARERVQDAIARATRAGADAADAMLSAGESLSVAVRLGALEDVGRAEHLDLGLRVFTGKRSASISTTDLSSAALDTLAQRAVAMAREAPDDEWAGLAPSERLMKGAVPDLDLDDGELGEPAALKTRALAAEDAARAVPGVTNSQGGSAGASRSVWALATSHGFAGAYAVTSHSISASVLAGETGAMERDYAYHSARHLRHLEAPEIVGRRAGELAAGRVNPGGARSGAMPVVFDRRVGPGLLGHLSGAISGGAITRKTSFLLDAMGTQIFAPGIRILDDPHRPHGLRSRPFDGEGLPVSPRAIVEDGYLETWLLDSAAARQLGLEPTGHASRGIGDAPGCGPSNLYLDNGKVPVETLIADIDYGIYVTELIGQGVNIVTGDYSRGAAGFLIEKGEITRPVSEITVAGTLQSMFRELVPANDLEFRYGINTPTFRIEGMTVASA